MPPNTLAIVIAIDEQYSEISWGANLNRLDGDQLRGEVLNPRLNERDYTGAIVRTFEASTERLQNGNLAFQELLNGYSEYIDEAIIIGALIGAVALAFYFQSQGMLGDGSGSSYSSSSSHSSSFRSSSSSRSSSSRRSSSSSGRSGGSSRGSWKD
jgi:hypothetical protein